MSTTHLHRATVRWTGNLGEGTREYRGYSRDHVIEMEGRPSIPGTSGLSPRSDPHRHNPEDLVVAALASCHMLWYLHLCSEAGVVVVSYVDQAEGVLSLDRGRSGRMTEATLRPHVTIEAGTLDRARALHEEAHRLCYVANSVNFPVRCQPVVELAPRVGGAASPDEGGAGPTARAEAPPGSPRTSSRSEAR